MIYCYVLTKTYPMDYIGEKLLVNPQKAQYITVIYFGLITLKKSLDCQKENWEIINQEIKEVPLPKTRKIPEKFNFFPLNLKSEASKIDVLIVDKLE